MTEWIELSAAAANVIAWLKLRRERSVETGSASGHPVSTSSAAIRLNGGLEKDATDALVSEGTGQDAPVAAAGAAADSE